MQEKKLGGLFFSPEWVAAWQFAYAPREYVYSHLTLYRSNYSLRFINVKAMGLVGTHLPLSGSVRCEYVNPNVLLDAPPALIHWLSSLAWNQLYFPDLLLSDDELIRLKALSNNLQSSFHVLHQDSAYRIAPIGFEAYLSGLSSHSRRKYFNRRISLEASGRLGFNDIQCETMEELAEFIDTLNQYHVIRWGKPCYDLKDIAFLWQLDRRLKQSGAGALSLGVLHLDGVVMGYLVDVTYQKSRYNLQMGYEENKLSIGSMLIGIGIETALTQNKTYYLLAGTGKARNYKAELSTHVDTLTSVVIERGILRLARSLHTWLQRG